MPGFAEQRSILESWRDLPALERLPPGGDRAALTFDDGPDPDGTPPVLDALDDVGARATFFVVTDELRRNLDVGREIVARGHELALHCHEHVRHDRLSPAQARDDVARGCGAIEAAAGRRPSFLRPPYGRFSEASWAACDRLGLERVYWSAWGCDWEAIPAARIAELVARDLEDGAIVLLHDSARYAPRADVGATVGAVRLIAEEARDRGLALVSLGEALRPPGGPPP